MLFKSAEDNYDGPTSGLTERMKGLKVKDDSLEIIDYGGEDEVCPNSHFPGDISTDDESDEQPRQKQVRHGGNLDLISLKYICGWLSQFRLNCRIVFRVLN